MKIIRMCAISKEHLEKEKMFKITLVPNKDRFILDLNYNIPGRGIYIKKDIMIVNKFIKSNMIERRFKIKIDENIYQRMLEELDSEFK